MAEPVARTGTVVGWLIAGDWRQHPARIVTAVIAIATGVALGFAVHLVNASALVAFGQAVRSVNGTADLQVRAAGPLGLDEALYPKIMAAPGVADASPVVELSAVTDRGMRVTLLGVDIMRAANVTASLIGLPGGSGAIGAADVFTENALFASRATLAALGVKTGDSVWLTANGRRAEFVVRGDLPGAGDERRLAVIDIAAAQWRFGRLGRIDRIDLGIADEARPADVRRTLAAMLPASAVLTDSADTASQSDALSRAYRINLQMLALVALLTGAFLVYSTQSLAVARRLQGFALLRTLGMQRSGIHTLVAAEGALTGIVGASIGIVGGYALAAAALRLVGPGLGGGAFGEVAPRLLAEPIAAIGFFALGLAAAVGGSIVPAMEGSRAAPAAALKNAGDPADPREQPRWRLPLLLLVFGVGAAFLPAVARLPLFGYLAVALLLAGGILAMPGIARATLAPLARRSSGSMPLDLAIQHLHGAPNVAATALCGIVASTALMTSMIIMVASFRGAVDEWLGQVLTGDLYLRSEPGAGGFDPDAQARLRTVPGVASVTFNRQLPLILSPDRPPMTLIVRKADIASERAITIGQDRPVPPNTIGVSLSEPAARVLHLGVGDTLELPIAPGRRFGVTSIWRDYARQQGAMAIESDVYVRLTGDTFRDDAAIMLAPGADRAAVRRALVAATPPALRARLQIAEPATLRRFALSLFDRSFAITYALEGIAILVGLAGVAATISAQAIARTREFGMLRHIGLSRRQIVAMLGAEGALLGGVGGVAGVTLGIAIGQVLIHVVNPQSFNWTMTTRLPVGTLIGIVFALVSAATVTAILAGRRAASVDAVRAVRSDW
jgi:putative ABC transport system permease protein